MTSGDHRGVWCSHLRDQPTAVSQGSRLNIQYIISFTQRLYPHQASKSFFLGMMRRLDHPRCEDVKVYGFGGSRPGGAPMLHERGDT